MMTSTNFGDKSFYKDNIDRRMMSHRTSDSFDINSFKEYFDNFLKSYKDSFKHSSPNWTPGYIVLQTAWDSFDIDLYTFKEGDDWLAACSMHVFPEGSYESKLKFYGSQIKSLMLSSGFLLTKEMLDDNQYELIFKIPSL